MDVGYGRGVVPKKEMRSLLLHPHCHCVYNPCFRNVKGKKKPWKEAVKETMSKFSEYEQKEILATRAMLERFKSGEDIERIFNILRPKYPIRKYIDLFNEKLYNRLMKKHETTILKKFENFDVSSEEKAIESFKKLWNNLKAYEKHIEKRLKIGHINSELDYLDKTLSCLANAKECKIATYEDKKNMG